uniref:Auxin response factor n=1 Tax=Anthurium amnicola TaxID=1678845 RepID=A0A1D1XFL3_9ARAE
MKEPEKCLDSQLWHACAGGMVQMPALNSLVYYFPQGHAEHAQGYVDFGSCPRIPPYILCRVTAIRYMADAETDEVFAKMKLVPVRPNELDYGREEVGLLGNNGSDVPEKPASFAKTLTQSDANNGGGFSVPRYCAETIFPRLDYSADPPVQTVLAKDVHGEIWKFRHIYRGTPRRHLLTTGWSTFVNQKKLVAGDSIVFLRTDNGELCVGIRRAKRRIGGGLEPPSGWNPPSANCLPPCSGFSVFSREDENKLMRSNAYGGSPNSGVGIGTRGRVMPDSVVDAATVASNGRPFEVVYYPRASTPEFCVKATAVRAALRINWCSGMRFKMAFETEDSSRISWFMGTISSVQYADPIRWPDSPWRLLQVSWDEPDLLQNVKCVSPWLVELVSNMPTIHLMPFSPPRKKLRLPQTLDFPLDGQLPTPLFSGSPLGPSSNPLCCLPDSTPAGIQGARHAQFGISLSDLRLNKLQPGLLHAGFHRIEYTTPPSRTTDLVIGNPTIHDNISCLLMGNSSSTKKRCDAKTPQFLLFGQPILTEQQISLSSGETVSTLLPGNGSSDGNPGRAANLSDGSGSAINHHDPADNSSCDGLFKLKDRQATELCLETGQCKVFMQSENVGRTLDLSVLGSYEELYTRMADMFGIEKSDMKSHVLYQDATGAVKHTGDEPFGDFMKTARRLQILMDSGSDNIGRY